METCLQSESDSWNFKDKEWGKMFLDNLMPAENTEERERKKNGYPTWQLGWIDFRYSGSTYLIE